MIKLALMSGVFALLLTPAALFGGGQAEEPDVMDVDEEGAVSQFEGLEAIDHEEGWQIGEQGGSMTLATTNDPRTFNGWVAAETSSTVITDLLASGMVRRNQHDLEFEPAMAEDWEIADDERSVDFTLREGLEWSDGEPITAEDFVYSAEIIQHPDVESNAKSSQRVGGEFAEWEAVDERTVRVSVPEVYAGLLTLSSIAPAPRHVLEPILEEEGFEEMNSLWGVDADVEDIPSSGAFVVSDYTPGQRIILERNDNYWETDEEGTQLPYLDEIEFAVVPDQDTALQRFLAGEIDLYGSGSAGFRGEDYAVLVDRQEELDVTLYDIGPDAGTQFITFNQNPDSPVDDYKIEWFNNKDFRHALAHLVDRETLIDNVAFGFGYPQYSFVPEVSPFYWEGAEDAAFHYDPDRAAEILDELGWTDEDGDGYREDDDGNRLSFRLQTNSDASARVSIGESFAQEAEEVGIEVNFQPGDFNAIVGQLTGGYDWEAIVIGLTGGVDPITGANVYPSSGNLHMIEPEQEEPRRDWEQEFDDIWAGEHSEYNANYTLDEDERAEGYQRLQEIWIEQVPWVYTYNAAVMAGVSNDYGNVYPQPIDDYNMTKTLHRVYQR
ncbi:MAG: ABC transporter substrate-binding protein [Spirochaetales bacterium]